MHWSLLFHHFLFRLTVLLTLDPNCSSNFSLWLQNTTSPFTSFVSIDGSRDSPYWRKGALCGDGIDICTKVSEISHETPLLEIVWMWWTSIVQHSWKRKSYMFDIGWLWWFADWPSHSRDGSPFRPSRNKIWWIPPPPPIPFSYSLRYFCKPNECSTGLQR